jgi:hypothetical protein
MAHEFRHDLDVFPRRDQERGESVPIRVEGDPIELGDLFYELRPLPAVGVGPPSGALLHRDDEVVLPPGATSPAIPQQHPPLGLVPQMTSQTYDDEVRQRHLTFTGTCLRGAEDGLRRLVGRWPAEGEQGARDSGGSSL